MLEFTGVSLYIIVFLLKIFNSTLSNLRVLLIADENIKIAAIVNAFATVSWMVSMAFVVDNIASDPFLVMSYVAAVVCGSYLGMFMNKKLAKGNTFVTVIVDENHAKLVNELESKGFTVSMADGEGQDENKKIIMIASPKKEQGKLFDLISLNNKNNFVIGEKIDEVI